MTETRSLPAPTRRQTLLLGVGAAVWPHAGRAQSDWPSRSIRLVVPYAPGGSSDTLGRLIGRLLGDALKQTVVIENKAGAGGVIGSQGVAKAAADGYTLVVSGIGSHVIAPVEQPNAFDPMKDFTHIAMLAGPPLGLVVNVDTPFSDFKTFVSIAGADPKGVSWGSPGQGTHGHLTGELLRAAARLNMVHISYKGAGPAVADLLANQIPAACMTLSSANAHVDAGKLRFLAVSSDKRLSRYPNVPTFAELGYPQLTGTTWFSLSGPPGLPIAIVERLNLETRRAMHSPAAQQLLANESMETMDLDAPAFRRYVASEIARWTPAVLSLRAPPK